MAPPSAPFRQASPWESKQTDGQLRAPAADSADKRLHRNRRPESTTPSLTCGRGCYSRGSDLSAAHSAQDRPWFPAAFVPSSNTTGSRTSSRASPSAVRWQELLARDLSTHGSNSVRVESCTPEQPLTNCATPEILLRVQAPSVSPPLLLTDDFPLPHAVRPWQPESNQLPSGWGRRSPSTPETYRSKGHTLLYKRGPSRMLCRRSRSTSPSTSCFAETSLETQGTSDEWPWDEWFYPQWQEREPDEDMEFRALAIASKYCGQLQRLKDYQTRWRRKHAGLARRRAEQSDSLSRRPQWGRAARASGGTSAQAVETAPRSNTRFRCSLDQCRMPRLSMFRLADAENDADSLHSELQDYGGGGDDDVAEWEGGMEEAGTSQVTTCLDTGELDPLTEKIEMPAEEGKGNADDGEDDDEESESEQELEEEEEEIRHNTAKRGTIMPKRLKGGGSFSLMSATKRASTKRSLEEEAAVPELRRSYIGNPVSPTQRLSRSMPSGQSARRVRFGSTRYSHAATVAPGMAQVTTDTAATLPRSITPRALKERKSLTGQTVVKKPGPGPPTEMDAIRLARKYRLQFHEISQCLREFLKLDGDSSGLLNREEFLVAVSERLGRGTDAEDYDEAARNATLNEIWMKADKDGTGNVDFEEFVAWTQTTAFMFF